MEAPSNEEQARWSGFSPVSSTALTDAPASRRSKTGYRVHRRLNAAVLRLDDGIPHAKKMGVLPFWSQILTILL